MNNSPQAVALIVSLVISDFTRRLPFVLLTLDDLVMQASNREDGCVGGR
jgi:hypothetical protein